jgi:hypothetical protein
MPSSARPSKARRKPWLIFCDGHNVSWCLEECRAALGWTDALGRSYAVCGTDYVLASRRLFFRRRVVGNHYLRFRSRGMGGARLAGNFS